MDSETILKSHILDILFENRNKAYGAYTLRRDYNSHLVKSLLFLFILIMGFATWQVFHKQPIFSITDPKPGPTVETVVEMTPPPKFKEEMHSAAIKSEIPNPKLVDKLKPDDPKPAVTSVNQGNSTDTSTTYTPGNPPGVAHLPPGDPKPPIIPDPPKPKGPALFADIPPQFPGGTDAFIKFLKRNLTSPRDLDENEETSVLVRFVVDLDGSLSGFEVSRSGGVDFDKEVLRVLHKMPKWVPGRTHGENISVYYTVPVKFTAQSD